MEIKLQAGNKIDIPDGCKATIKGGNVIFEKEEQEFKDGDVLYSVYSGTILIFKEMCEDGSNRFYSHYNTDRSSNKGWNKVAFRHATEEKKQLLFDKMKEQGLLWNAEKKRVEKIRWRAEYGCRYYLVTSCLKVGSDIDFRHTGEEERLEFGNYFRTKEQAEEAAKRVKETLQKYHEDLGY